MFKISNNKVSLCLLFKALVLASILLFSMPMDAQESPLAHKSTNQLYSHIAASNAISENPNFVFSPHSIFSVFSIAQVGARGETLKQMNTVLNPKADNLILPAVDPELSEVIIESANRVYISHMFCKKSPLFSGFMKDVSIRVNGDENSAESMIETISFDDAQAAADQINGFVAMKTRDHITDLVPASAIDSLTRMVLVNALYFKSAWASQFSIESTHKAAFHVPLPDGSYGEKLVDFMESRTLNKADRLPLYYEDDHVKAVGIYYKDETMRFYIFQSKEHINNFEARASQDDKYYDTIINEMNASLKDRRNQALHLKMPKFKLSAAKNKYDMKSLMRLLDVVDMFDMQEADFTGIQAERDLYVSDFIHQADIAVDENGTEAAAASAMVMRTRMAMLPPDYIDVTIDHPFVFQLRWLSKYNDAETDHILFAGRVADPSDMNE